MNKFLSILLLLSLFVFSACKKGDEDPFFSIYSREKRLCGNWDVTYYNYEYKKSVNQITTYKLNRLLTNGNFTDNYDNSSYEYKGTYNSEFIINKNGTYRKREQLFYSSPYDTTFTKSENGNWYFVNKNNDKKYKNKEVVAFQPLSITYSPINNYTLVDYNLYFYEIIKLKNKEVKFKRNYSETQDSINLIIDEDIILSSK